MRILVEGCKRPPLVTVVPVRFNMVMWMSGLNQRFAKPSVCKTGPQVRILSSPPMVGSTGVRRGLISPGDRSDGLKRKGSNPLPTTNFRASSSCLVRAANS